MMPIVVAVLLAAAMWYYMLFIWLPPINLHFSDLYPSWYATREFFLHHRDPYGSAVTREIQTWIYGHPNTPGSGRSVQDHQFVHPAYVCFLLWPAIHFTFGTAQNAILALLAIATAVSAWLWLLALNWKPSATAMALIVILTLGSCPAAQGLYLRQLGLLAAGLLAATAAAAAKGKLRLAGVLLALATIKPQLSVLLVAWMLIWSLGKLNERKAFLWSFFVSMALLAGGTALALPSWPVEFWKAMQAYPEYNDGRSVLQLLLGHTGGQICAIAVVAALLWLAWKFRHSSAASDSFMLMVALMLSGTLIVIPTMAPHGQVLLLAAMLWLWRERRTMGRFGRVARFLWATAWSLLAGQWLFASALTIGAMLSSPAAVRRAWVLPFSVSPFLPVVVSLALAVPVVLKLKAPIARIS